MELQAGYLEKLGGSFGNTWQKRYFIIRGTAIYWYKKLSDTVHKGTLKLKDKKVKINPLKPLIFTIPSVKKDYQLKGQSKEEIDKWIAAIKCAGATIEEIDTSNSPIEVKRKSSGLLSSLKRNGHHRKRSISDTSLIKETEKENHKGKTSNGNVANSNIDLTKSIRENYSGNLNSKKINPHITSFPNTKELNRPDSIYDLHLRPIEPFAPVILPVNQFKTCHYVILSDEALSSNNEIDDAQSSFNESNIDNDNDNENDNDNPESFTYSSSSELQIQIPVLVEYCDPEEENI